ncbi:6-bladed beta-propeller [Roseivirga sp.]|uniref:6-bladed beta-propeller n=1 Tax=Roseivirga sp. TaxID=1964215 RepID=UPI003B8AEEBB
MKSHIFSLPLIIILAVSCQEKKEEVTADTNSFKTYKISMKAEKTDFTDRVQRIEILGLEETGTSLLQPNALYFPHENGVVVINEGEGDVTSFDKQGKYISHFNRKGLGPEEYSSMASSNFRDGIVETISYNSLKMMQYDLQGNLLGAIKLPYVVNDALFFEDGYLLGMAFPIGIDSVKHNLILTDAQLKPTRYALPLNKPEGVPVTPPNNAFQLFKDNALFNPFWTDSIYQIKGSKVEPYAHLDFGDDWLWKDFPLTRSLDGKTMDAMNKSGKVWAYLMVYGEDRIEMNYSYSFEKPPGLGFVDKKSGKFYHYEHNWSSSKTMPLVPIRYYGHQLLAVVQSDAIEELVSAAGNNNAKVIGAMSLEEISSSENPVLVWIDFK